MRADVTFEDVDHNEFVTTSNVNGRFEISLPNGTYQATVDHIESTTGFPISYHHYTAQEGFIVDGDVLDQDIILERSLANTTYSCTVLSPEGTPAARGTAPMAA